MKDIDICGLGNPIIDSIIRADDTSLAALSIDRGSMRLVREPAVAPLGEQLTSGGSVANSVIANAQLGASSAYIGCIGDDSYGSHFAKDLTGLGVVYRTPPIAGEATGKCSVFVSEDGERTMQTNLGAFTSLSPNHIDEPLIARSQWLFIEGYVIASGKQGEQAIIAALECAKRHDCRIAFTLSADWLVEKHLPFIREVVSRSDLVFGNAREVQALTNVTDVPQAWAKAKGMAPNIVMTLGSKGAYLSIDGVEGKIEPVPCVPVDSTGAGDMFAGALLFGLIRGVSPLEAGHRAAYLASRVVSQYGARLAGGIEELWSVPVNQPERRREIGL